MKSKSFITRYAQIIALWAIMLGIIGVYSMPLFLLACANDIMLAWLLLNYFEEKKRQENAHS